MIDCSTRDAQIDEEIAETELPDFLQNLRVNIKCHDCELGCETDFHIAGLKCHHCGGYNTTKV